MTCMKAILFLDRSCSTGGGWADFCALTLLILVGCDTILGVSWSLSCQIDHFAGSEFPFYVSKMEHATAVAGFDSYHRSGFLLH